MFRHLLWLIPLIFLLLITPFVSTFDIAASQAFYHRDSGNFSNGTFFEFLYQYGEWPALLVGILAAITWIASYSYHELKKWRPAAQMLTLTLVIGAGIITNGLLKNYWERPRPKQTIEFGGDYAYHPYYKRLAEPASYRLKSFPSGHAMMGFYFLAFVPIGIYYRSKKTLWFGLIIGLGFGLLMSVTRIAQGGHFLSDTLFSAFLTGATVLAVSYFILNKKPNSISVK